MSAQFIAAKATRDALYLAHLDVTTLPVMVIATAVVSILLVVASSRALRAIAPGTFVPAAFALSAALLLGCWFLLGWAPRLAAQLVYLQISGLGPMLGSGFWLIATERFDPHTARLNFGRIAGVGTITGLVAALVTERIGATVGIDAMLPLLAALNMVCAWQIRRLAGPKVLTIHDKAMDVAPDLAATSPRSGLRVLAGAPYLRNLAALVLLGTVAATLADYVFKVQAVEVFGRGDALLQFFALYYAGVSLLAFIVQSFSAPLVLEKLGLAITTATPSLALVVGGLGGLVFPGLSWRARGSSWRIHSSKLSLQDGLRNLLHADRFPRQAGGQDPSSTSGSIGLAMPMGGGLIRLLIMLPSSSQYTALLGVAIGCSAIAVAVAQRLSRGYIHTLERSLLDRAVELELSDVGDITTRTVMMRTIRAPRPPVPRPQDETRAPGETTTARAPNLVNDAEVREIVALRSRNRDAVLQVLRSEEGLQAALIPHVIPLLAWDPVAEDAVRALRKVAEERVGELVDALLDPNQPFAVAPTAGARLFCVRVATSRRWRHAGAGRSALRGAIPVRTIPRRHPREESEGPRRQGAGLRCRSARGRSRTASLGESPAARHDRGRFAIVRGRVSQGSRGTEPGACLHAAVTRVADGSPADRVSRSSYRRPGAARHGARVPGRRAAARHSRSPVALPQRSPEDGTATAELATKSSPTS